MPKGFPFSLPYLCTSLLNLAFCSAKPKGARLGYMGHLTLMSEDVISALEHYPADLRAVIAPYAPVPAWEEYVHGRYHETKKKDTALLGGGKPVIAPGQRGVAVARWKADDNEAAAAAAAAMDGGGELTKSVGGHPTRAQTADFGPAEVDDDEDDEDDDDTSPQVSVVLAGSICGSGLMRTERSLHAILHRRCRQHITSSQGQVQMPQTMTTMKEEDGWRGRHLI